MKPSLCPYAEYCTESQNKYAKCPKCIYSKYRTYYRRFDIEKRLYDNKKEILQLREKVADLEKSKAEEKPKTEEE